jgi:hypothetical protein
MNIQLHTLAHSNPDKSPEWYTPAVYADAARQAFGGPINLDPASSIEANLTICAQAIYTREVNGLTKEWWGNVWLNAPSAEKGLHNGQRDWQRKLLAEYEAGRVNQAVMLVYRVATDTKWFQELFKYPLCFVNGRIKFVAPVGVYAKPRSQPLHASAFCYLGPRPGQFADAFNRFGWVIY